VPAPAPSPCTIIPLPLRLPFLRIFPRVFLTVHSSSRVRLTVFVSRSSSGVLPLVVLVSRSSSHRLCLTFFLSPSSSHVLPLALLGLFECNLFYCFFRVLGVLPLAFFLSPSLSHVLPLSFLGLFECIFLLLFWFEYSVQGHVRSQIDLKWLGFWRVLWFCIKTRISPGEWDSIWNSKFQVCVVTCVHILSLFVSSMMIINSVKCVLLVWFSMYFFVGWKKDW